MGSSQKRRYWADPVYRGVLLMKNMLRKYFINRFQWDALLILQQGRCAVCRDPMTDPHVDHDHESGRVRGLLCDRCNKAVGFLRDDPALCEAAAEYLRNPTYPQ